MPSWFVGSLLSSVMELLECLQLRPGSPSKASCSSAVGSVGQRSACGWTSRPASSAKTWPEKGKRGLSFHSHWTFSPLRPPQVSRLGASLNPHACHHPASSSGCHSFFFHSLHFLLCPCLGYHHILDSLPFVFLRYPLRPLHRLLWSAQLITCNHFVASTSLTSLSSKQLTSTPWPQDKRSCSEP